MEKNLTKQTIDKKEVKKRYERIMSELVQKAISNSGINPFSTSTGTIKAIKERFEICEEILVGAI